jgi:ribosomal protein S18 acetylase RimI-like enzyme
VIKIHSKIPAHRIVELDEKTIDEYDLFCSKEKDKEGYKNKVKWLKERFKEGLHYKLLIVEDEGNNYASEGFIEYIPGESIWRGINAPGWMGIHCILVSNKYHNLGFGSKLLEECFKDSKGMNGVVILTSHGGEWEPTKSLFLKHDFKKVDEFSPFELYAKIFDENAILPKFNHSPKVSKGENKIKLLVEKSNQCPYGDHMTALLEELAEEMNTKLIIKELKDAKSAQENSMHPYSTFCVFSNGKFLTRMPYYKEEITKALGITLKESEENE